MEVKSRWVLAGGIAAGLSLIVFDRLAEHEHKVIMLSQEMPVPSLQVFELIKQVENEPDLIDFITSVEILEQAENCVRYTVKTVGAFPAVVTYKKWWDDELPAVYWESEKGTAGFHHKGSIHLLDCNDHSEAYLRSEHWITAPVIGRIAGPMITPVIESQLSLWLKNITAKVTDQGGNE